MNTDDESNGSERILSQHDPPRITESFNNTSISTTNFRGITPIQTGFRQYGGHQDQATNLTFQEGDITVERTRSTVLPRKCLFTDEEIYATESRAINQQFAKVIATSTDIEERTRTRGTLEYLVNSLKHRQQFINRWQQGLPSDFREGEQNHWDYERLHQQSVDEASTL